MLMQFKSGDRVHVTRFNDKNVDFYGTVYHYLYSPHFFKLKDCSNNNYENRLLWKDLSDSNDYYTLATDEEDSEPVEVQHIEEKQYLDNHYIIEVKKGLYVRNATSNYFFKFTNDINKADVYEYENAAMKHAEFVDGRVLNLKRHVEVE